MADETLTYPSLRCVLEYLEANKRIHICSRHPILRNSEKNVPLHLNDLRLFHDCTEINNIVYDLFMNQEEITPEDERYNEIPDEKRTSPGDIYAGEENPPWESNFLEINHENVTGNVLHSTRLPIYLQTHFAAKKMNSALFQNRNKIFVKNFEVSIYENQIMRLPVDFKIHVRCLNSEYKDFPYLLPIIDETSYPLAQLSTPVESPEILQKPELKSAKSLVLTAYELPDLASFSNLSNPFVTVSYALTEDESVIGVLQNWREFGLPIGCIREFHNRRECVETMKIIEKQLNGRRVEAVEVEEKYTLNTNCIAFLLNAKTELLIYGLSRTSHNIEYLFLRMETVPAGSLKFFEPKFDYMGYLMPVLSVIPHLEVALSWWNFML